MNIREAISDITDVIKSGGIGIIPTDTMYGMIGSALIPETVEKIFEVRKRDLKKPLIVLISSLEDLKVFKIQLLEQQEKILKRIWPGPVSVEFKVNDLEFPHLTRGTGRFAVRLPDSEELRDLVKSTGPLVAPSVNMEGEKPAETMDEAWETFSELDFYIDGGMILPNNPSTVVSIEGNKLKVWRQGKWQVPEDLL